MVITLYSTDLPHCFNLYMVTEELYGEGILCRSEDTQQVTLEKNSYAVLESMTGEVKQKL